MPQKDGVVIVLWIWVLEYLPKSGRRKAPEIESLIGLPKRFNSLNITPMQN